jgi:hypothetical protein
MGDINNNNNNNNSNNNNAIGPTTQNQEARKINSTNALALFKDLNFLRAISSC